MKGDRVYLLHIEEAIANIQEYVSGGKDAFFSKKNDPRRSHHRCIFSVPLVGLLPKLLDMLPSLPCLHPNHPK